MDNIAGPRLHPLHAAFGKSINRIRLTRQTTRGEWRNARRLHLMIGYTASLSLLLVLANLPLGRSAGHGGKSYTAYGIDYTEPLPLITVHEIKQKESPAVEKHEVNRDLPPVEQEMLPEAAPTAHVEAEMVSSMPVLRPADLTARADLRDVGRPDRWLRTAVAPPPIDRAPKLRIGSMIVRYPLAALKKAIEGLVIVKFTVETDGRAHAIEVVLGLHPDCDAEVVQALENARFVPGRHRGRPVPAYSQMTVRFVLADASKDIVGP